MIIGNDHYQENNFKRCTFLMHAVIEYDVEFIFYILILRKKKIYIDVTFSIKIFVLYIRVKIPSNKRTIYG